MPDHVTLTKRRMVFVDGENLAIEGYKFALLQGVDLPEGPHFRREVFWWSPDLHPIQESFLTDSNLYFLRESDERVFYFTSCVGTDKTLLGTRQALQEIGFKPVVFKKFSGRSKSAKVDIALATEMITNAYIDNFDLAILVSGDSDFVPAVEAVQRQGKLVVVAYVSEESASHELLQAADAAFEIGSKLLRPFGSPR